MSVMVFGYRFLGFYFYIFFLPLVSIEKIFQTLKTAFDYISKHPEVSQKYSAARRFFSPLLGVWNCGQTRSFVFYILRLSLSYLFIRHVWICSLLLTSIS